MKFCPLERLFSVEWHDRYELWIGKDMSTKLVIFLKAHYCYLSWWTVRIWAGDLMEIEQEFWRQYRCVRCLSKYRLRRGLHRSAAWNMYSGFVRGSRAATFSSAVTFFTPLRNARMSVRRTSNSDSRWISDSTDHAENATCDIQAPANPL